MRFEIGETWVGEGEPCYIVAELSCNHRGSLAIAEEMIRVAAACGANAVKLQTDNPDGGITINCGNKFFRMRDGPWRGRTLYDLYYETYTPWFWLPTLRREAAHCGVELFSTPSCLAGATFLHENNMPAYKISSFEITDLPLIRQVASYGKPIILSDGCAQGGDIQEAIGAIHAAQNYSVAVLNCASQYPADASDFNLPEIRSENLGISDHSKGNEITLAAVALGAKIVERHFTLSRNNDGPDASFSLEPSEFAEMVSQIRSVEAALKPKTLNKSHKYCKSIFVVHDIAKGEKLTTQNLGIIRPGAGLHPREWGRVLGMTATKDLESGQPLRGGDFE